MDGGRDMKKLAVVSEVFKFLNIAFLQETHTDDNNNDI